jgi:hypothetical protein
LQQFVGCLLDAELGDHGHDLIEVGDHGHEVVVSDLVSVAC